MMEEIEPARLRGWFWFGAVFCTAWNVFAIYGILTAIRKVFA